MTSSWRIVFLLPVALVLSACILYTEVSEEKFGSLVNTQLRPGTSRAKVEEFLKGRSISYSASQDDRELRALLNNTCRGILMECAMEMTFKFDDQGMLESHTVEEVLTGL